MVELRNFRWGNLQGIVNVINRANEARGLAPNANPAAIRDILETKFEEPERDCFVAVTTSGEIVGVGTMRYTYPHSASWALCVYDILPEYSHADLGQLLLQALEAHLLERFRDELPSDAPIVVWCDPWEFETEKVALLRANRYEQMGPSPRTQMSMTNVTIASPILPDGISFRPWVLAHDMQAMYKLFQDSAVYAPGRSLQEWRERFKMNEDWFETALWPVAWHGEEMVGVSVCFLEIRSGEPQSGRIVFIGVRKEYPQQDIALALLRQSLLNFQQRGVSQAIAERDICDYYLPILQQEGFMTERTRLNFKKHLQGSRRDSKAAL